MTASPDSWRKGPEHPRLGADEVHVWRVALDQEPERVSALRGVLSEDELERAGRFHFRRDADHFVVARAALRDILGRHLGVGPERLRFETTRFGKPSLSGPWAGEGLFFNLSHSGGWALYAVARGREVGIDVERVREDFDLLSIAEHHFSRREIAELRSLSPGVQVAAFFDCWTRKEAIIKACGEGLSMPLDRFDVSLLPGVPARLLRNDCDPRGAARWSLRELHPGDGYAAALAVEGDGWSLSLWQHEPRG